MTDLHNDPDFTPDVGEFIEVLEPTTGTRAFRVLEVPLELTLAEALERLAQQRNLRPEQLAGEILAHMLEALEHPRRAA